MADGRLVYAARECSSSTGLYNQPIGSAAVAALPPADCPAVVRSGHARVTQRGVVRLKIKCPSGCAGGASDSQERGREIDFARGPSRRARTLRFTLTPGRLAALPCGERLAASLSLRVRRLDDGITTVRAPVILHTPH